jgi:hypothetical protein
MSRKNILPCILLLFVIFSCSSESPEIQAEQKEALIRVDILYRSARLHQGALKDVRKLIMNAEYNFDLMVTVAEYISIVPHETVTLTRIAEIASKADRECPLLNEVVELPILLVGRSDEVIRVAELCCRIKNDSDRAEIEKELNRLRSFAKYKSVDEALQNIEKSENN